jgi:hypothetical protein
LRYFDPTRLRAGTPEDVAALIDKVTGEEVTVTLVNINPTQPRTVVIQAGAYGEHQFVGALVGQKTYPVAGSQLTVRLEPGCGDRLTLKMKRYANQPTLMFPWDRN